MIVSPLQHSAIRHEDSEIVMTEGELEGATGDERMLIAPFHIHLHADELFYVLSGTIGFIVGNNEYIATPGAAVLVPRGHVHTWWNASELPARYLIVMPKQLDNLINALHAAPLSPNEMEQVFIDHDSTLIGWTR